MQLTPRGTIHIPFAIRKKIGIEKECRLTLSIKNDESIEIKNYLPRWIKYRNGQSTISNNSSYHCQKN